MNVCLIGNSLTNLVLAKILANKNIKVTIFYEPNRKNKFFSRTIGISKNNFDFFIDQILDIEKISWPIKSIKVFNELSLEDEILNFRDDNSRLLSIVKYNQLFKLLNKNVANNKYIKKYKIKNKSFYDTILKNNQFNFIVNSDSENKISKEIFFKKIKKDYKSSAYTTLIQHEECTNNQAIQIFTKKGPLAFLPCSTTETSIIFSIIGRHQTEKEIKENIANGEFAKAIFELAERQGEPLSIERVVEIRTDEYPTSAKRPLNSRLSTAKLESVMHIEMPSWRESLEKTYLKRAVDLGDG